MRSTPIEMKTSPTQPMSRPNLRVPLSHDLCQPFASEQFHALLNSLFKVLFNFPSRYLFAIGLVGIFSLGWSIPPVLSCTHKQLDSGETPAWQSSPPHGPVTLYGKGPRSNGLGRRESTRKWGSRTPQVLPPQRWKIRCWADPRSLAVTGGILFSFFSSAK